MLKITGTRGGDEEEGVPSLQPPPEAAAQHGPNLEFISISISMSADSVCFFQLSNEMQLSIMERVKSGELSIEDALDQARRERMQLLQQQSQAEEVPSPAPPSP